MCHYQQTSPESHFTQGTLCTLATKNGHLTLTGEKWIVTEDGSRKEQAVDQAAYEEILRDRFGIAI